MSIMNEMMHIFHNKLSGRFELNCALKLLCVNECNQKRFGTHRVLGLPNVCVVVVEFSFL